MKKIENKSNIFLYILITLILVDTLHSYDFTEGQRWRNQDFPIYYRINLSGAPGGFTDDINECFETWESEANGWIDFEQGSNTSLWADSNGVNTITWEEGPPDYPAWCDIYTNEDETYIVEIDLIFNTNVAWGTGAGSFRVKNVGTHEVGHWLSLNDLYGGENSEKTMYRWILEEETKKETLDEDDIDGLLYIYKHIRVPTDYSTFGEACSEVSSGQTIVLESTISSISATATIPSGVTLKINNSINVYSGTLTFASGSKLGLNCYSITEDGGTIAWYGKPASGNIILWDGTELEGFGSVQSAINAASSGNDVYVGSGSYSTFDMKQYVDVHGAGKTYTSIGGEVEFNGINYSALTDVNVDGIVINSGWGNEITDVRVSTNRIEINNGYWNYLNGVDAYNIGLDREIYIYNGAAEIDGFISNSSKDYGIYVNGDELYIYGDRYEAEITDKWNAIYLTGYADALVDYIYFCDNDYDIWAASGSSAEAGSGTIFSGPAGSKTYGDVSYPYPNEDCGSLKKSIVAGEGISVGGLNLSTTPAESDDPGLAEYQQALEVYRAIRQKLRVDIKAGKTLDLLKYAPEFSTAVDRFKQVISKYPGSPSSIKALSKVAACYWALNQPQSLSDYLNTIVDNPRYAVLKPHARSLLIPYHLHVRDYHQALQVSDEILADPPDENLSCDALYGKGIIYLYYVEDTTRASEAFQQVLALYPDNPTAVIAQAYLEELGESVPIYDKPATAPETADELALEGYPNPFNPTATIRFGLPEAGKVALVIYDLLGREVLRLVEGSRDAGWQAVVWDGRDARGREVPTGIYIARLITPQGAKAMKLVMMK